MFITVTIDLGNLSYVSLTTKEILSRLKRALYSKYMD